MQVTRTQQEAAEVLVNFVRRKQKEDREPFDKSVDDLFYFVLKTFLEEYYKSETIQRTYKEFTIFLNYKILEKKIMVANIASVQDFVFLEVDSISEAKKVMEAVADIYNDINHYRAEYRPRSKNNRGSLKIFFDA